ncbi:MAG: cyclic nucleotide-binding/CBS domain-containing protein, partial [Desulfomonile tiedjei]|nr:cyclic nucleotide-binding/CBS domain-containing protein [Desulfomonile tiedjei]
LRELSQLFTMKLFPKQTMVYRQDVDDVNHFYLIYKGSAKTYLTGTEGGETLLDFRGEGGYFGALAIIRGSKANFNVEIVEDALCLELDKEAFLELIRNYPRVSEYYLKKFSEDLVGTAYAELRERKMRARPQEMLYLFNVEVGDVVRRPPEIIHASQTIQQAAERMSELEIGSLLIQDQTGEIAGIVTDKDLRKKVVARGHDYAAPVATVMSSPVRTIPSNTLCFDALLHMMNERLNHLAVERGKQIVGMVSVHDIMVQQGSSPLHLFREIVSQRKIEDLYPLSEKIPRVVRALVEEGARANNITRIISVLNDQIVQRLLTLLNEQMGPAPHPFCWITFGSEGRKEQTFKTDQDNALIYDTPADDWDQIKLAKLYFRRFGNEAAHRLNDCGYPLCKGQMMASNPRWRKPFRVWRDYFDRWMVSPEPEEVLNAMIFFDFRPAYGKLELAENLRDYLSMQAPSRGIFLLHLARDCMAAKSPLTFFKNFVVEKDGKYKNHLDLKTQGLTTFVNFARLMALRHGITETNTLARLEILAENEWLPRELYMETRDAYEFQMQLRLVNQLRMIEAKQAPNNYVDPGELSELEKQTLKEAFAVIGRIQSYVKSEFRVLE